MKYKVLLVDDEPIILSGIKFILDWSSYDCEVVGTARNGEQALDFIRERHPDIVVADIKMPVMDGLELLERSYKETPDIVFIMLTSLAEFTLVKQSLQFHAADYLIKTEIDERSLAESLRHAIAEHDRRSSEMSHNLSETISCEREKELIAQAIGHLQLTKEVPKETFVLMNKQNMLDCYAFLGLYIVFPGTSFEKEYTPEDRKRLFAWEGEVAAKILPTYVPRYHQVQPLIDSESMYLWFCCGLNQQSWRHQISQLKEKLDNASSMVTGLATHVLATPAYHGQENFMLARQSMDTLRDGWYLETDVSVFQSLDLDGVYEKIERDIKERNLTGFTGTMERTMERIRLRAHRKAQALWILDGILTAADIGLSQQIGKTESEMALSPLKTGMPYLAHRRDVLVFLKDLQDAVLSNLATASGEKSQIIQKAKQYIHENLEKKIMLQDVADVACVSPGYLSSLFKRIRGQSLVDYINQCKIEKAKELMDEGKQRINEIAYELGFENIYYFSKVFKRMTGIPPTQYLKARETTITNRNPNSRQAGSGPPSSSSPPN